VREEEQHLDFFDTQLAVLERVGEQNYLARYAMPEST
jgi:bacterioferritin (cytochrome b1)